MYCSTRHQLPGTERWEFMDILHLRTEIENAGFTVSGT